MTISKDRVKPSRRPDQWKLKEIFATGIVMGTYLALVTVLFYWAVTRTTFFEVTHQSHYIEISRSVYSLIDTKSFMFLSCRPISR